MYVRGMVMKEVYLVEANESKTVFAVTGRIDSNNATAISDAIIAIWEANPNEQLVSDMSELEYISSAGLRIFLTLQKKTPKKIKLINLSEEVYDIFAMTGFDTILDVHRPIKKVSIDGATKISQGANGEIFKTDVDTIYKVYQPNTPMEDVDRERNLAKLAFLKGIPTAISYDVASLEDGRLAIGFEMLDADSLSTTIKDNPDKFDELAKEYVRIYKMFHEMEVEITEFPSAKDIYMEYINGCVSWYNQEEIDALRRLVNSIPDRNTLIHGDYHAHNIMYQNGELIMIDMGDISYGHPIFDFLATAATQANLVDLNPAYAEIHTGMPVEYIKRLWNSLLRLYFEGKSEEEISAIDKQIRLFSKLKVAFAPVVGRGLPMELIQSSVDDAKINLIPYIDSMIGSINW